MPTFAEAAREADRTGRPVAEGFAVRVQAGADTVALDAKLAGWNAAPDAPKGVWRVYRLSAGTPPLTPDTAWDRVRQIRTMPGVEYAEPLVVTRTLVTNGSDARESFKLWGVIRSDRLKAILEASDAAHMDWSLKALGVPAAWEVWKQKHGATRKPGDGILVAHPDTGYTKHPRLLPKLQPQDGNPGNFGVNFVERSNPDGEDPMRDRGLLQMPGHGTSTGSVIVADADPAGKPWGVAPGARLLPLRVSSSVIHLSFLNLCDAFDAAIAAKADVISMSLGGPGGSEMLADKVWEALDAGIIVVSAAGNNAPTVVFPAKIPGVLACAASNALTAPWRFSGMGEEVAITAPGERVWHDWTKTDPGPDRFSEINGDGTSFATANVAGLAALWVSYWGRDNLVAAYGHENLIPFGFRHALQETSRRDPKFIKGGGFGTGIAQADKLLQLPLNKAAAVKLRDEFRTRGTGRFIRFPVSSWWSILTLPTLTALGPEFTPEAESALRQDRLEAFLNQMLGVNGAALPEMDRAELGALAETDTLLLNALGQASRAGRNRVTPAAVRRYLLRPGIPLSPALRDALEKAQKAAQREWVRDHPGLLSPTLKDRIEAPQEAARKRWEQAHPDQQMPAAPAAPEPETEKTAPVRKSAYSIAAPQTRRLRAYAFDPSLATRRDGAAINEITIPVVFEEELLPGPVGDYLAVVDVDPASDCAYAPVDLNHPYLLAQDGLPRSEGNPQFHQQMVYAVAMKTINHFEDALGRPLFWSHLRPWNRDTRDEARAKPDYPGDESDKFVQRLRLYPHALRAQNAYYSPQKRAILFGYFPAGDTDPGAEYPGGVVFTCLAHDIIAHEMTHAILDGMHVYFTEPTNPDVFAFHEAFADIVALFQRFTYPELLQDQIARSRGQLDAGTLMTRLALQFGQATGRHQALRDALGRVIQQARQKDASEWRDQRDARETDGSAEPRVSLTDAARNLDDQEKRELWKRFQADPALLAQVEEPHERGSFLVAAVFDAYLSIYEDRIADLRRIATGGTGILPDGELHPDLVNRMAEEAAKSARHVLKICIRAMDYTPPVDITFGEFLRALITADMDLVPDDPRRYRVAFIEAFRKWGIYPRDVRVLSEESLRWSPPTPGMDVLFPNAWASNDDATKDEMDALRRARRALLNWQPGKPREEIFKDIKKAQYSLHKYLKRVTHPNHHNARTREIVLNVLSGIDPTRPFHVTNLRPARRIGPNGEFFTEMVVEIIQNREETPEAEDGLRRTLRNLPFRGGVTLIVSMTDEDYSVRYAIYKRPDSTAREARQREFLFRAGGGSDSEAAEYSTQGLPDGWYSDAAVRDRWRLGRTQNLEDMRASSCGCRRARIESDEAKAALKKAEAAGLPTPTALTEPFALLHEG